MLKTTVLKSPFRHTVFQIGQILSRMFMKLGSEIRVDIFFYESDDLNAGHCHKWQRWLEQIVGAAIN